MPVVYLPPDPRQTALSQGIQALATKIAQKRKQARLADILQQSGGDVKKALPALTQEGQEGVQLAGVLTQLATAQANQERAKAEANKVNTETQFIQPKFLLDSLKTQSESALNNAKIAEAKANTLRAQAQAATEPIKRQQLIAEANKATIEAQNQQNTAKILAPLITAFMGSPGTEQPNATAPQSASQPSTQGQSASTPQMPTASDILSGMDQNQKFALGMSAASGKPQNVAETTAKIATANTPKPLPGKALDLATGAAAFNSDIENFVREFPNIDTGSIRGRLTEMATQYGISPEWMGLSPGQAQSARIAAEAERNAIRNGAIGGGGFMSKVRVDLAKGVLPSFTKDKLTNIASIFVFQSSLLSQLESMKSAFSAKGMHYNTAPLDEQIAKSKQILHDINNLDYDPKSKTIIDMNKIESLVPEKGLKNIHSDQIITRQDVRKAQIKHPNLTIEQIVSGLVKYDPNIDKGQ